VNGPFNPGLLYNLNFSEKEKGTVGTTMLHFHEQTSKKTSNTLTQTRHGINLGWNGPRQLIVKQPQSSCRIGMEQECECSLTSNGESRCDKHLLKTDNFPISDGMVPVKSLKSRVISSVEFSWNMMSECQLEPTNFKYMITWQPETLTQGSQESNLGRYGPFQFIDTKIQSSCRIVKKQPRA
jgi:hypothetical protein